MVDANESVECAIDDLSCNVLNFRLVSISFNRIHGEEPCTYLPLLRVLPIKVGWIAIKGFLPNVAFTHGFSFVRHDLII